jgi:hypothetical protein
MQRKRNVPYAMADEKKPKIDLKSRLNKMGAPAAAASGPALPQQVPGRPTPLPPAAIPVPPGIPKPFQSSPPARLDPNNPLAAVAVPFQTNAPPAAAAPAQPQRIEVDEGHVHEARKGVRNIMLVVAMVLGVVGAGIGWLAGGSSAKAAAVTKGQDDAHQLAKDLTAAKANLQRLADLVSNGQKQLAAGKYPDTLEKDLSTVSVGFDGKNLGYKSFNGVSQDTLKDVIDFITGVQGLEKKKASLREQLVSQKQAITDYMTAMAASKDSTTFKFVVTIDRESLNAGTRILPLAAPLTVKNSDNLPQQLNMPGQGGKAASVDRFLGVELKDKPFALLVAPGAEAAICGQDVKSVLSQITKDMTTFVNDIRAESAPSDTGETKTGLAQKADTLINTLNHI